VLYAISTGIVSINISCYLRSFYYRTLPGICYLKSAIILQNVCSSYATIFSEMAVMFSQTLHALYSPQILQSLGFQHRLHKLVSYPVAEYQRVFITTKKFLSSKFSVLLVVFTKHKRNIGHKRKT
jgi:hypothetical protein